MSDDFPPVLDAEMVSNLLGLNIDTVRRLSRDGTIPSHRLPGGRAFRYLKDEILDWLRAQPAHNPPTPAQQAAAAKKAD